VGDSGGNEPALSSALCSARVGINAQDPYRRHKIHAQFPIAPLNPKLSGSTARDCYVNVTVVRRLEQKTADSHRSVK
jgi:hypothetical protein